MTSKLKLRVADLRVDAFGIPVAPLRVGTVYGGENLLAVELSTTVEPTDSLTCRSSCTPFSTCKC
jgi:hypothetical protein